MDDQHVPIRYLEIFANLPDRQAAFVHVRLGFYQYGINPVNPAASEFDVEFFLVDCNGPDRSDCVDHKEPGIVPGVRIVSPRIAKSYHKPYMLCGHLTFTSGFVRRFPVLSLGTLFALFTLFEIFFFFFLFLK